MITIGRSGRSRWPECAPSVSSPQEAPLGRARGRHSTSIRPTAPESGAIGIPHHRGHAGSLDDGLAPYTYAIRPRWPSRACRSLCTTAMAINHRAATPSASLCGTASPRAIRSPVRHGRQSPPRGQSSRTSPSSPVRAYLDRLHPTFVMDLRSGQQCLSSAPCLGARRKTVHYLRRKGWRGS